LEGVEMEAESGPVAGVCGSGAGKVAQARLIALWTLAKVEEGHWLSVFCLESQLDR
jgi:hypothetical protein